MEYLVRWEFWLAVIVVSFVASFVMHKLLGGKG